MAKVFPKKLYVAIMRDSDTEYFTADENAASLVEMGQKINIATYQLVEIARAKGVAEFKKLGREK